MDAINKVPLQSVAKLLVQQQLLNHEQALQYQQRAEQSQLKFLRYLVMQEHFCAKSIAQSIALHFGIPFIDLDNIDISSIPTRFVDEKLLRCHPIVPLFERDHQLYVAIDDPSDSTGLKEIQFNTGLHVRTLIAETDKLYRLIEQLLQQKEHLDLTHYDTLTRHKPLQQPLAQDDTPVVKFVNRILHTAIKKGASDVHFEPYAEVYHIRFRIDGLLHISAAPPISLASRVAARIKVMANLDISERRLPQDGRFKLDVTTRAVDCRVSTCPTLYGEKVVVRILNTQLENVNVSKLDMGAQQQILFLQALQRPQGLILVTGPTGSGKTTTLYSALHHLNSGTQNISTVEDPIEMDVVGINQTNINPKIGLNFPDMLRSLLRQDPDIIMIGEIRDQETAKIAINAALTGHLVLSTLHANSAIETLARILNLGVSTFNFASAIQFIIAQRLVRRLCPHCKITPHTLSPEYLMTLGLTTQEARHLPISTASGCKQCTHGYQGRIALFEMLPISSQLSQLILSGRPLADLQNQALRDGMQSLYQMGLEKVKAGLTTIEEIGRILVE